MLYFVTPPLLVNQLKYLYHHHSVFFAEKSFFLLWSSLYFLSPFILSLFAISFHESAAILILLLPGQHIHFTKHILPFSLLLFSFIFLSLFFFQFSRLFFICFLSFFNSYLSNYPSFLFISVLILSLSIFRPFITVIDRTPGINIEIRCSELPSFPFLFSTLIWSLIFFSFVSFFLVEIRVFMSILFFFLSLIYSSCRSFLFSFTRFFFAIIHHFYDQPLFPASLPSLNFLWKFSCP